MSETNRARDILAWMALRKERKHWARELRKAEEKKDPVEAIEVLKNRVQAIDQAMKKFSKDE